MNAKNLVSSKIDSETEQLKCSEQRKEGYKKEKFTLFLKGFISLLKNEIELNHKYEDFCRLIFGPRVAYLLFLLDKLVNTTIKMLVNINNEELC